MNFSLCFRGTLSFLLSCCFNTKQGKAANNSDDHHLHAYTVFWGVGGGGEEIEGVFQHVPQCSPKELLNVAICVFCIKEKWKIVDINIIL